MKGLSQRASNIAPSATLSISARAGEMKRSGLDVISFGVGEPDFDTPQNIKNAAKKALDEGFTKYTPISGVKELKSAICDKLKKDNNLNYGIENIVVSTGAKQALYNVFFTLLNKGDEVLLFSPYWVSYPEMIKMCDGVPVILKGKIENDLKIQLGDMENAVTDRTKAIVINSPCNPSGTIYSRDELVSIAAFAKKHDLYIISDEIYEKLIYDDGFEHISIASLDEDTKSRTILINGVSKAYSMTGFRIGYSASSTDIAKLMNAFQGHTTSNPNSIAQMASLEAISGDQASVVKMKDEFKIRRNYMVDKIGSIEGISCINPHGAFYVMVNMSKIFGRKYNNQLMDGKTFCSLLLEEEKVAVIPCDSFGEPDFIRLSYALSLEDIKKGLDRIEDFIKRILQ